MSILVAKLTPRYVSPLGLVPRISSAIEIMPSCRVYVRNRSTPGPSVIRLCSLLIAPRKHCTIEAAVINVKVSRVPSVSSAADIIAIIALLIPYFAIVNVHGKRYFNLRILYLLFYKNVLVVSIYVDVYVLVCLLKLFSFKIQIFNRLLKKNHNT